MTDEAPRRYKLASEHSATEAQAVATAQRNGLPAPAYETSAYRQHKAGILAAAGLADEAGELEAHAEGKPLADMSVAEHLRRVQQENGPLAPGTGYPEPDHANELPAR
jgi:hypothetical protein